MECKANGGIESKTKCLKWMIAQHRDGQYPTFGIRMKLSRLTNGDLGGHVIYVRDKGRTVPYGVVVDGFERRATYQAQSKFMHRALVELEDKRFHRHRGLDARGIARAAIVNLATFSIRQGGSTITQQLARSLLNDFRRSPSRKLREALLALQIERKFTKDDILKRYFNEVRWGGANVGVRAAAIAYFGRDIHRLSKAEQVALLTLLRGPNHYLSKLAAFEKRLEHVQRVLVERGLLNIKRVEDPGQVVARIKARHVEVFRPTTAVLFASHISKTKGVIESTLERNVQELCSGFVRQCSQPTSIVVLRKGRIAGMHSAYGIDHAHDFKFNVGSTLKPFVYMYLRRMGYSSEGPLGTANGENEWPVREVSNPPEGHSLRDALVHSWNAPFVRCAYEVGVDGVLEHLSRVIRKPVEDLYPASILGATKHGLSLLELARIYSEQFDRTALCDQFVRECHGILTGIATSKLKLPHDGPFLKTGTTNDNRERLLVGGQADITFAILREGSTMADPTKSGGLIADARNVILNLLRFGAKSSGYQWI